MNNPYRKDRSYIKQRLEYVNSVDYISELEEQIENLQIENEDYKSRCEKIRNYVNSTNFVYDEQYKKKDKIENILNGGDE